MRKHYLSGIIAFMLVLSLGLISVSASQEASPQSTETSSLTAEQNTLETETSSLTAEQNTLEIETSSLAAEQNTLETEASTPATEQITPTTEAITPSTEVSSPTHEGYSLDKVVILSRHNIRSPLGRNGSLVGDITAHKWFDWTSAPGELSRRGGILETIMGQYFRLRMEEEGLFPTNYIPEDGAVRFYANAKQRTIATAHYFVAGLLPVANVEVETHAEYDTMDPVFNPALQFTTKEYEEDVLKEIAQMGEDGMIEGIHAQLTDAIKLLMKVIDPEKTEIYRSGKYGDLLSPKTSITLEAGNEPAMVGAIKTATQLADALTLQYYEEEDLSKAAFDEDLSWDDWAKIHTIVDTYQTMLFGTKLLAVNEANLLLKELRSEMDDPDRKFSYLCGHDSNVTSVLTTLGVEPYQLPGTFEANTPIGVKVVFERWIAEDGEAYYTVSLIYQSAEQIREMTMLSLNDPPMSVSLSFTEAEANENGMIPEQELLSLMDQAIDLYDAVKAKYSPEEEAAAQSEPSEAAAQSEPSEAAAQSEPSEAAA